MGRPDARSFTRLLVSLGGILCVLAVLGPGWILRDTGTLRVTARELRQLTPHARTAMISRQHIAADLGEAAPYLFVAFLVVGASFIVWGARRLYRQEVVEQEHATAEKDIAQQQLRQQGPDEVERSRRDDVAEMLRSDDQAPAGESRQEIRRAAIEKVKRAGEIEDLVIERLRLLADTQGAQLNEHPAFKAPDGSQWSFDVLITPPENRPQVLTEIKYATTASSIVLADTLQAIEQMVSDFEEAFSVVASGWLIIVAESITSRDATLALATEALFSRLSVLLIHPAAIATLEFPSWPSS